MSTTSGDSVRIKRTTIERGVRSINPGSGDGDSSEYSLTPSKVVAAAVLKQKRDQEKQTLNELNNRFAKYIDRVKYLEGQNKRLLAELDELRTNWGDESRIVRERYEPELLEARALIDDTTREKAISEIKSKRAEYEAQNLKRQYDEHLYLAQIDKNKIGNLEYLLQENQVELDMLHRQMNDVDIDIDKYKKEIQRLNEDLSRLLQDLDHETLKRIKLENEKQTLEEQIPFMNAIHEQEMAELRLLHQSSHIDPAQFYRHELERAIREIRSDFEDLSHQQKRELEEWYKVKTEEIVQQVAKRDALDSLNIKTEPSSNLRSTLNESNRDLNDLKQLNSDLVLRLNQLEEELDQKRRSNGFALDERDREIGDLRSKLQDLMSDYDELMSNKASLEFEINTYRRLLDTEAVRITTNASSDTNNNNLYNRVNHNAQSVPSHPSPVYQQHQQQQQTPQQAPQHKLPTVTLNTSEMSAKTTFQRSAKGPVSISECSPDGKVIILENTSRNKDVTLTEWVLKRKVDSKPEIVYKFPADLVLKANKIVRIWSRGANGKENLPTDLINRDVENWGMGVNVHTTVLNDNGEEKATHLQKTVYS